MSAATKGTGNLLICPTNTTYLFAPIFAGIFIVSANRTAFGTFGGIFKNTSATTLQTAAAKAAIQNAGLQPNQIDTVNIGNVLAVIIQAYWTRFLSLA